MEKYEVKNIYNKISDAKDKFIEVNVPGSKSITNRALLFATLADGNSTLNGVLFSDDSRHFLECVSELGFDVRIDEEKCIVDIKGLGGRIPKQEAHINVGSAGTAARFLAATLGVSEGVYHLDSSQQMKKRPMGPLIESIKNLGCVVEFLEEDNHFPFILKSHGFGKSEISINIDSSSQFLSALMIASVLAPDSFTINVNGSHGMAYIEMTAKMMKQFGVKCNKVCDENGNISFITEKEQSYKGHVYDIEPDASGAAYFYAMSPLLGIRVCVPGIHFDSLQGDVEFIHILEKMGCHAKDSEKGIILYPPEDGIIKGIEIDMSACSDQAITLAAIAPFADGPTRITGIGHIRLQESDRLSAIAAELTKMGIRVEEKQDEITIHPGMPAPALVKTYDDHRMAMGFSLIGLRAEKIVIDDPMCCRKTFENYFDKLDEVIEMLSK